MKTDARMLLPVALCAAVLGLAGGYWLRGADAPTLEVVTPQPQVTQSDGSVLAERAAPPMVPSAVPGRPAKPKKPPHQLPKGSTEERRIEVVVQSEVEDCPPVQVDLSLVRDGDGRRVVASSPDGRVLRALDMPITAGLIPPPVRPWAAGASFEPVSQRAGVWIERDFARLRIGADVQQADTGELRALVRLGWRW